jgi:endonuclease YncB( thermonuclease family)
MSTTIPNHKEFKGMVELHGSVDLNQFYYRGGLSDADTVKINLTVDSVRFRPDKDSQWLENLQVFFNGPYVESPKRPVVDKKNRMTIRLQGIDAPELHYRAQEPRGLTEEEKSRWLTKEFRQYWGARCTSELVNFLNQYDDDGSGIIKATFFLT